LSYGASEILEISAIPDRALTDCRQDFGAFVNNSVNT